MTSPFEIAASMTSAAVDRIFGEKEGFQFVATMASPDVDLPRVPDPARPTFTAIGAYAAPSQSMFPPTRGPATEDNAQRISASVPLVSFDNANLAWPATVGDRVTRLKTGETFEISRPMPDGVRRTIFYLSARKRT
ncbi:hypothetical protein JQ633_12560 [Bradyrhizobium tropiciagri]|uniref:hypothetical protein n=1 Tax=Bradyrhizobium tropiciagri TaxID=312253 RepID=UPI001BAB84D1|nr:hypothetical protein [Bradyrhizobium tropiciagri]MBR0871195.1 hypothetical protein [Bradyrhizobium tropiciagri]